ESPAISGDGRYIVFWSAATNLVADNPNSSGIFVYDQFTGQTKRASASQNGQQSFIESVYPGISGDGRSVAFWSNGSLLPEDTNGKLDIYVYDQQTEELLYLPIGEAGDASSLAWYDRPALSWDGQLITFASNVATLVSDDTNNTTDIFVYNRQTAAMTRVSVNSSGVEGNDISRYPSLSADGRLVAFMSSAENFTTDTNGDDNGIFVYDRVTGKISCVSVNATGIQANNSSFYPHISSDGRYVAFSSYASNLVPGDTNVCGDGDSAHPCSDIFVYDRQTRQLTRTSVAADGTQTDGDAGAPSISGSGNYVTFSGRFVTSLTANANGGVDVFLGPVFPLGTQLSSVPQRNCTSGSITLTWGAISWATGYRIQVDTDKVFDNPFVNQTVTAEVLEWTLTGLEPQTYYWRVQAIGENNRSGGWSTPESFTVNWQ
ncbi:MAG TPA: hypothetical protein VHO69_07420, partial [Phototrophicaceae bacterium]|nr:hypothetical protein [Phototrophicaceae bacterium]